MRKVYQAIASALATIKACQASGNTEWEANHRDALESIVSRHIPSGSGLDGATELLESESTPERLVFAADFHHMNDGGYYCGWTEHRVIVKASLAYGIEIKVTGRDRNGIKEYIADAYWHALTQETAHMVDA